MLNNLLILWLAAFPLMGSPGPATISLAALGSAYGIKQSVSYYLGIVTGTACVLLMIAFGLTSLLLLQPELRLLITILAAVYILYLAYKIAIVPVSGTSYKSADIPKFRSGFFLAVANPKAFAAIGAVYSGNVLFSHPIADAISKTISLLFVIFVVNYIWLVGGSVFSVALTNPAISRRVNIAFAVLLVLSVGLAMAT